ncbi:MAG: hypothetical protein IJ104_00965 [Methanobrevibacter sp.]|nr:hypothetical protein [Methanobrevibacter sp.]MBQ9024941.1 hypothetical protein [Methanobrevibacter sp.]
MTKDIKIPVKIKTEILEKKLNELDLTEMTPTELEKIIKENVEVVLIEKQHNTDEITEKIFHMDINTGEE